MDFTAFLSKFPVSSEGQPPNKRKRLSEGFSDDRTYYDRWRGSQFLTRQTILMCKYSVCIIYEYNIDYQIQKSLTEYILFSVINDQHDWGHFLLSAKYIHRKPTVQKLEKLIKKHGWTANYPTPNNILPKWTPASKESIEGDARAYRQTRNQKWKGLVIQDFGGDKGKRKKTCIHLVLDPGVKHIEMFADLLCIFL